MLCNIWIPDGLKDIPGDRMGPRGAAPTVWINFAEPLDGVLDAVGRRSSASVSVSRRRHDFYLGYALYVRALSS